MSEALKQAVGRNIAWHNAGTSINKESQHVLTLGAFTVSVERTLSVDFMSSAEKILGSSAANDTTECMFVCWSECIHSFP